MFLFSSKPYFNNGTRKHEKPIYNITINVHCNKLIQYVFAGKMSWSLRRHLFHLGVPPSSMNFSFFCGRAVRSLDFAKVSVGCRRFHLSAILSCTNREIDTEDASHIGAANSGDAERIVGRTAGIQLLSFKNEICLSMLFSIVMFSFLPPQKIALYCVKKLYVS